MEIQYMEITPEIASDWLEKSNGNPRWKKKSTLVDQRRVKKIANDITCGNWHAGNNSIAFDTQGILVDGHHRLSAIKLSGTSVFSIVVFGLESDALQHIDENRTRGVAQRLGLDSQIIGAVNCHFLLEGKSRDQSETSEVIMNYIEDHPMIFDAESIVRQGTRHAIAKKSCVIHGTLCALECGVSKERLQDFMESVNTGFINDINQSAAIVLRNMLMSTSFRVRQNTAFLDCSTQNAIYDYIHYIPRKKSYTKKRGVYFDFLRGLK